jgi:hypothetical protein
VVRLNPHHQDQRLRRRLMLTAVMGRWFAEQGPEAREVRLQAKDFDLVLRMG